MSERVPNDHITVSAAGKATRISDWMYSTGYAEGTPKSALPTGAGETLLGRVVRQAMPIGRVAVYGNYSTMRGLGEVPDLPRDIDLVVNRNIIGPLGPIYLDALRTGRQSYMAAADFWAELDWKEFVAFHNDHDRPASILVAPSVPAKEGARFQVAADGAVKSWERVAETKASDLINIGAYIIDGDRPEIMDIVSDLNATTHKEDPFNSAAIEKGLLGAYVLDSLAFNVNNQHIYRAMLEHTSTRPVVPEPISENPIRFAPGAP